MPTTATSSSPAQFHAIHTVDGIIESLQQARDYTAIKEVWLTESDIQAVLNQHITKRRQTNGMMVRPPVELSYLAGRLDDIRHELETAGTSGPTTAFIPINFGSAHWVVGKFTFNGHTLQSGQLTDSMAETISTRRSIFSAAVKKMNPSASVQFIATGIQTNGYDCGCYALQTILKVAEPTHPIATAPSAAEQLRPAIVQAIARARNLPAPVMPVSETQLSKKTEELATFF